MSTTATFSERLSLLIKEKGISQNQIALDMGLSPQALSRYLVDGREPRSGILIRIAKYFNVSTDYLLGFSEFRNNKVESFADAARVLIELLNHGFIELSTTETVDSNVIATFTIPDIRCNTFFQELSMMQDSLRKGNVTANVYVTWYYAALKKLYSLDLEPLHQNVHDITCVSCTAKAPIAPTKKSGENETKRCDHRNLVGKTGRAPNGIDTQEND